MAMQLVFALLALAAGPCFVGATSSMDNVTTTTPFETTTVTTTVHTTTTAQAATSTTKAQPSVTSTEALPSVTVEVSAQLSVDNCQSFTSQPGVKEALAEGMASAAGGGVTAANVEVTMQCSRRLSSLRTGAFERRLAETCSVVYRITVEGATAPDSAAVVAIVGAISGETESSLTEKIKAAMTKRGIASGSVSVASIATPIATVPGATTTSAAPAGSGGSGEVAAAHPRASYGGAVSALAAILSLAISL